ncbi:MAG: uL15 family ribosomal protein, partial [Paraglaciecola chathamensis]
SLKEANVIGHQIRTVKIMSSGAVSKAYTVKGIAISKGAKEAIEAAGGKIES